MIHSPFIRLFTGFLVFVFITSLTAQAPLLRHPDLSSDGQLLSFSYLGDIFSTNNGSRAGSEGKNDLMKTKWDGKNMSVFIADLNPSSLALAPDQKSLFHIQSGKLTSTPLDKGKATAQAFEAQMTIEHEAERRYLINDGWRALNAGFYDPEFHGRDRAALKAGYSNAEIFSHTYKQFGLGKLVGRPTFGAVISTGSHRMLDGSTVRMPFRAWFVHGTEENMEGGPAVPDILVQNAPDNKARNRDAQLQAAVEALLLQLGEGK